MKTILIIGSTGTIGQGLVSVFKNENCIEASRSLETKENLIHLDLSSFISILDFLDRTKPLQVDILFMNSGIYVKEKEVAEGYDSNVMVNAFGPYYLVKEFCKYHPECKIVLTSSISILHAKLDMYPKKRKYIYRNTKLLEHILFYILEESYPKNRFSYAHPGILPSRLSLSLHSP